MKAFFELGDRFAQQSSWKDFALTKFCLCAIGILLGLCVPEKQKRYAGSAAMLVFLSTYIPLMSKVVKIGMEMRRETAESED